MPETPAPLLSPRQFAALNAAITIGALGFLVWLIYFHDGPAAASGPSQLPAFNALFNAIAATFLVAGRIAIRRGQRKLHQQLMISALVASALFLVNYIHYHYSYGDTLFQGSGWIRPVYFTILISHIALSAIVFPAILTSVYLGLTDRIARHRKVAKWTWAGWMYVSVTGIVVFMMLHVIDWS